MFSRMRYNLGLVFGKYIRSIGIGYLKQSEEFKTQDCEQRGRNGVLGLISWKMEC